MTILGIDVSKTQLDVCLRSDNGTMTETHFKNNVDGFEQLQQWLSKQVSAPVTACLEATGAYSEAIATCLYQVGHSVSVVNPARIKAYAASQLRRNKTDKLDAQIIADFCRTQKPSLWTPADPAWRELRALVRHLGDLTSLRFQQINRRDAGGLPETVMQLLQTHIDFIDQQMEQLKRQIQTYLNQHPLLRQQRDLLISIPGIGELTAAKLLTEIPNILAFDKVRQLVAYAGLNPKQHRSGSSVHRHTHISKTGSATLRSALYMPALVAKNRNPILIAFAQRLKATGLTNKEIIVAVMRKLLHLIYGILKSGQPFDPNYLKT